MPVPDTSQVKPHVERLVSTYANLVLRLSYARLGSTDAAQDICQQVFLKLVELSRRGLASFASPEHEKAWIIRATINACSNERNAAWNSRVVPLEPEGEPTQEPSAPPGSDPADVLLTKHDLARVHEALATLPPAQRQAIYLRYYENYGVKDIASLTGESPNTVSQHLSRARAKLRDILEGDVL